MCIRDRYSKQAKKKKRADWRKHQQLLEEELEEAWEVRDAAKCWSLCRRLSQKRVGPKLRRLDRPPMSRPSLREWTQYLGGVP
eukprot:8722310-Lingulodinium_polyedra.AAC.1